MTDEEMTKEERAEEWIKQNCCECCVNKDDCDAGTIDCFAKQAFIAGYETMEAYNETQELLDKQIEATYKVVEENNALKAKYDTRLRENTGLKIHNAYVEKKLAEAKDIIRELLNFDIFPDVGIKRQAEQFLEEEL